MSAMINDIDVFGSRRGNLHILVVQTAGDYVVRLRQLALLKAYDG